MMTDIQMAMHEAAHALTGAVALHALLPAEDVARIIIEVECKAGADQASTIVYAPHQSAVDIPYRVFGLCAMGPAAAGSIEKFRDVLRAKQVSELDTALSAADHDIIRRNGGHCLTIKELEILTASAKMLHGSAVSDVARAILEAGSLIMTVDEWLPEQSAKTLLRSAGRDFMSLHSRFETVPKWAADWINREYMTMQAYS